MVPERVRAIETTAQLPWVIDVISVLCSSLFRALLKQEEQMSWWLYIENMTEQKNILKYKLKAECIKRKIAWIYYHRMPTTVLKEKNNQDNYNIK